VLPYTVIRVMIGVKITNVHSVDRSLIYLLSVNTMKKSLWNLNLNMNLMRKSHYKMYTSIGLMRFMYLTIV
jgi:hypothetical protein